MRSALLHRGARVEVPPRHQVRAEKGSRSCICWSQFSMARGQNGHEGEGVGTEEVEHAISAIAHNLSGLWIAVDLQHRGERLRHHHPPRCPAGFKVSAHRPPLPPRVLPPLVLPLTLCMIPGIAKEYHSTCAQVIFQGQPAVKLQASARRTGKQGACTHTDKCTAPSVLCRSRASLCAAIQDAAGPGAPPWASSS